SPDMEVDFVWIDSRNRDQWPASMGDAFRNAAYDVFILGDLDAGALGEENLKLLAESVERGKGLALLGGYHSFGAGGYRETPLANVMPILMNRFERQDFDAPIREDLHLPGPLRFVPVPPHPIINLANESENDDAWARLPSLSGANKFAGVKEAAGVRTIACDDQQRPLLVVGEYGRGRVVAMAGDSTWQWCMHGHQDAHKRFWRQMVLWLVGREDMQQDDVWIQLDQRRFAPDSRVEFNVGVKSPSGTAITGASIKVDLVSPDGDQNSLRLTADEDHWTGIIERLELPGDYAMVVTAEKDGRVLGTTRGEFLVYDRDIELSNAAADHDQLSRLAAVTEEFGGRVVAPEQLTSLLEEIRDKPPEMEIEVQTKWQLADTPRDAWALLIVFVALLTGEWILRKRWGLV
ncbi:MAG: glutamine amidotransferase, partial [Planctomycetes bacterium]|nr:glutamine amidotransferase [Planctomycetota bacterium]